MNTTTLAWPQKIKPVFEQNTEIVEDCKAKFEERLQGKSENIVKELELGFYFLMDYNEDRQLTFGTNIHGQNFDLSMATNILKSHKNQNAFMYLDTIGEFWSYTTLEVL